jgi:hypothetical protein
MLGPERINYKVFLRNLEISEKESRETLSEVDMVFSIRMLSSIFTDIGGHTPYQEWACSA